MGTRITLYIPAMVLFWDYTTGPLQAVPLCPAVTVFKWAPNFVNFYFGFVCWFFNLSSLGYHDIQHNITQHNDNQDLMIHNNTTFSTRVLDTVMWVSLWWLSFMLNVANKPLCRVLLSWMSWCWAPGRLLGAWTLKLFIVLISTAAQWAVALVSSGRSAESGPLG